MSDTKLYAQYQALERSYKILDEQRAELREQIVSKMLADNLDKTDTDFGTFSIGRKKNWKYSPAVDALVEKVKVAKTKEEQKGIAQASVTPYLLYKNND